MNPVFTSAIFLFLYIACTHAQCPVSVQISESSSWHENGRAISMYDVTLLNNGYTATPVSLKMSVTPRSFWSLSSPTAGEYSLPSWLSSGLAPSSSLTFGFIAPTPSSSPIITIILPTLCASQPATLPPSSEEVCGNITFSNVFVQGWSDGVTPYHLWHTTITNMGTQALTKLDLSAGDDQHKITQIWSVDQIGNHFGIPSYAIPLSPSASYTFGYIVGGKSAAVDFEIMASTC